jgi:hypothetical protein
LLALPAAFYPPSDKTTELIFHIVILLFVIVSGIEGSFTPTHLAVFDRGVDARLAREVETYEVILSIQQHLDGIDKPLFLSCGSLPYPGEWREQG